MSTYQKVSVGSLTSPTTPTMASATSPLHDGGWHQQLPSITVTNASQQTFLFLTQHAITAYGIVLCYLTV
jgi:hypothetical protein